MEELATWHASGSKWSLNTDKLLFKAIQDLSGDIMSSIQRLETDLSNIESDVRIMSLKAGHAAASFNELCQTQYIQQAVGQPEQHQQRLERRDTSRASKSNNIHQIVNPEYREALQLAAEAFQEKGQGQDNWKPLPHIFGSPEYLQDATFGIQEAALLDTQTTVDEEEARDKLSPLPGEMVPDVSEEGNGDDLPSDSDMPDFRSMLEAALRGEFDEGLEDLENESEDARGPGRSHEKADSSLADSQPSASTPEHEDIQHSGRGETGSSKGGQELSHNQQTNYSRGGEGAEEDAKHQGSLHSPEDESSVSDMSSFGQNPDNWEALVPQGDASGHGRSRDAAFNADESRVSLQRLLQDQDDLFSNEE